MFIQHKSYSQGSLFKAKLAKRSIKGTFSNLLPCDKFTIVYVAVVGKTKIVMCDQIIPTIVHFTVVCLVIWPLSGSEAGGNLILIQTLLLFICKYKLVSMTTT